MVGDEEWPEGRLSVTPRRRSVIQIRPTVPSDLAFAVGEALPFRIKAMTLEIDGHIVGLGGLAFPPGGGPPWAFVQQRPEAKRYPVAFHRAGLAAMKMIGDLRLSEIVATADAESRPAVRWLHRLGFVPADVQNVGGKLLFVWRRSHSA